MLNSSTTILYENRIQQTRYNSKNMPNMILPWVVDAVNSVEQVALAWSNPSAYVEGATESDLHCASVATTTLETCATEEYSINP
jgi:hypothetical protein